MRRLWSEKEDDFLRKNYAKLGAKGCAKQLEGRSADAIRVKVQCLGLQKTQSIYKKLSPAIEEMYMQGVPVVIIAKTLGLNRRSLYSRLTYWGLPDVKRERDADLAREIAERHGLKRGP